MGRPNKYTEKDARAWAEWYHAEHGRSLLDTSLEFNVSADVIRRYFRMFGIEIKEPKIRKFTNRSIEARNPGSNIPQGTYMKGGKARGHRRRGKLA